MRRIDSLIHKNLYYFFESVVKTMSALSDDGNRLQPKEIRFLVCCCVINCLGYDLNDYDELHEGLSKHYPEFEDKDNISQYKTRIAGKKFIKSGRDIFKLPAHLDYKQWDHENTDSYQLNIQIDRNLVENNINKMKEDEFSREDTRIEEGVL